MPRLRRLRAEWIPAYAGMTVKGRGAQWGEISAFAGMTGRRGRGSRLRRQREAPLVGSRFRGNDVAPGE